MARKENPRAANSIENSCRVVATSLKLLNLTQYFLISLRTFYYAVLPAVLLGMSVLGCSNLSSPSEAVRAKELAEKGNYSEAIKLYEMHIQRRISHEKRPPNENPYFYYLLIGDLYLDAAEPENAKTAYLTARDHGIDKDFIADRIRLLAAWHRKREDYQKALKILQKHRALDELLFDADIDLLHKEMVYKEQSAQ